MPPQVPTRKSHAWEQRKQEASDAEYDFEGEALDTEPTQLRCVLEVLNTGECWLPTRKCWHKW